jgi:hypothetical protein
LTSSIQTPIDGQKYIITFEKNNIIIFQSKKKMILILKIMILLFFRIKKNKFSVNRRLYTTPVLGQRFLNTN